MRTRLGAAVLGVLGGILLTAGGGFAFLARDQSEWQHWLAIAGYAVAVSALLLVGYGLVASAPVWLRLIVSVGLPLLAASVWQVVADEIARRTDGWCESAATDLTAGLVALAVSLIAARVFSPQDTGYQPTHR